mgnify:CR=1 FL=1
MQLHAAAIRYFDAVRRVGSIRGGARELNVASSAVNRQILKLESEIEAPLFERLNDGLKLTEAGELFARHVTTVLQDTSRFEDELAQIKGGKRGNIKVVAVCSKYSLLLGEYSKVYRQQVRCPSLHQ